MLKNLFHFFIISTISVSFCPSAFPQTFTANDITSFESALTTANTLPDESHKIDINGDIILNSSLSEPLNLSLNGTDEANPFKLTLNGNTFSFTGANKISSILNLSIIANTSNSGIINTRQALTIENSSFLSSASGNVSLLTNNSGMLNISNSIFSGNKSPLNGAAIRNTGVSVLNIENSKFSDNVGGKGGSIYFNNGTASIKSSDFTANTSSQGGGAIYIDGGKFDITSSTFSGNYSINGGAISVGNGAEVVIDSTAFDGNYLTVGSSGGAISNSGKLTVKNNSSFTNNKSESGSGGAIANTGTMVLDNVLFENNIAKQNGGAIESSGNDTITNSTFRGNKSTDNFGGAILGRNLIIDNCVFESNSASLIGGGIAVMQGNADISNSSFIGNSVNSSTYFGGGAMINYLSTVNLSGTNVFENNTSESNGGAITATTGSITNISGNASFINNSAKGLGGGIFSQGTINITADNSENSIIFSGNTDSNGTNAVHLDIYNNTPVGIGTMNVDVSNGAKVVFDDNISGVENTKLNIVGTSHADRVCFGSANENLKSDITTKNVCLEFYNEQSNIPNALITAENTLFNFANGFITNNKMQLNLSGNENAFAIDVDPANGACDYFDFTNSTNVEKITIKAINLLSNPSQSLTVFDIFDHELYGTNLALDADLEDSIVYGALKKYKWSLSPKLTLTEMSGFNPNIQRYQAATAAAFMNQILSYDYSLARTDEIYSNLREQKLANRKLNSYAYVGSGGMYVDQYYEDGSAFWIRPYVNLETFHLSGALASLNNQSYGMMMGFDFPMYTTGNDFKIFSTIYGAYIGSTQYYENSKMYQNGGYGGYLLSLYKDDFYAGWTINGGGLGIDSKYAGDNDEYAIVTAGTALKLAYNFEFFKRLIVQPNFTTSYTFLNPTNLVNFQSVDINQSIVNGLVISPSLRLTFKNESGFEPYAFGGCVIPIMSDIRATADSTGLDKLKLNAWAQFGAGVRKRISDRVTCFAETVIRTGGRVGWGFLFNVQVRI